MDIDASCIQTRKGWFGIASRMTLELIEGRRDTWKGGCGRGTELGRTVGREGVCPGGSDKFVYTGTFTPPPCIRVEPRDRPSDASDSWTSDGLTPGCSLRVSFIPCELQSYLSVSQVRVGDSP